MRVLTWNLKHGRAVPPAGRELFDVFADVLAGWEWEIALLQEVPPWWPRGLAARTNAQERHVLTSRNSLLALRRAIAVRWPDAIKSNGGGCNAILVRAGTIAEHRARRLGWVPERRWVHAVELAGGVWAANLHTAARVEQGVTAAAALRAWAGDAAPAVLGGDFNVRDLELPGFLRAGGHGVDQVFVRGGSAAADGCEVLERPSLRGGGVLSDHAPVVVEVDVSLVRRA